MIAVDPSRRCWTPADAAPPRHECARRFSSCTKGTAEDTGAPDAVADAVLSVNNVMLWPDRAGGLAELYRVLRPGGRLLVSVHAKWLPGGPDALAADTPAAGFVDVELWDWELPGRGASLAVQLRGTRPA